jgi:hypothetical protein
MGDASMTTELTLNTMADVVRAVLDTATLPAGRDGVQEFENRLRAVVPVNQEVPVEHIFAPGMYARAMYIPRGTVLTGKIHRHAHLNILLSGKIEILTEDGVTMMTAPQMFVSSAGTKRAGFAYEDTVWVTVHATKSTDLSIIEKETVCDSFEELQKDYIDMTGANT